MGELHIGTSGWSHDDWRGLFYPYNLRQRDFLAYYGRHFKTVELNYSFDHQPRADQYEKWARKAPEGFLFAVQVSKSITHAKKLAGVTEQWRTFLENASKLGDKLGPLLLELPPSFRCNTAAIGRFLDAVPEARKRKLAVEARHSSWFDPLALDEMRQLGVAMVIAHSERYPEAPHVPTARFVYLRFHGPGQLFASSYSRKELERWAERIRKWLDRGRDVYAYFNNDFEAHAVSNAKVLRRLVLSEPVNRSAVVAH